MEKISANIAVIFNTVRGRVSSVTRHVATWILLDMIYIGVIALLLGNHIHLSAFYFFLAHISGIIIGTMVMFTGLGAGALWIPILTFLEIKPLEAVSISIFTQIAGKGMGSLTYLLSGMVDLRVARYFIPYALLGAFTGYVAGFVISMEYEKLLLYIFILVAGYLIIKMIQSLHERTEGASDFIDTDTIRKSYLIVILSSFFTGLLSIGNTDWLIPYMERKLKMSTSRSVATGLFVMFITSLFFLFMVSISVCLGLRSWPHGTSILFATCSGVILGGQFGTRLIRYRWFRERQRHAFILLLSISIIRLLWQH